MEEEREEEGEEETCHQAEDPTSFFFKQLCGVWAALRVLSCVPCRGGKLPFTRVWMNSHALSSQDNPETRPSLGLFWRHPWGLLASLTPGCAWGSWPAGACLQLP